MFATDGLWDVVTPEQVAEILQHTESGECPATKLVRASLTALPPKTLAAFEKRRKRGETVTAEEFAKEGSKMASALLSLEPGIARYYRDDITVVVLELQP